MVGEFDEKQGLIKVYWRDIRKWVAKIEPFFAKLVDELGPDKSFPLFIIRYDIQQRPFFHLKRGGLQVLYII